MSVVSGAYGGALCAKALPAIAAEAASMRVANFFIFFLPFGKFFPLRNYMARA
jgi:hypothetical protein